MHFSLIFINILHKFVRIYLASIRVKRTRDNYLVYNLIINLAGTDASLILSFSFLFSSFFSLLSGDACTSARIRACAYVIAQMWRCKCIMYNEVR